MRNKMFFDTGGRLQERDEEGSAKFVPFPVCLAIKFGDEIPEVCPDFILNIDEAWVLINTASPLPEDTSVQLHFYIPPENKLLAELEGRVRARGRERGYYPSGMFLKLNRRSRKELMNFEKYVEGTRRLIDKKA